MSQVRTGLEETLPGGEFARRPGEFQNYLGDKRYPAVAGRYHLYLSLACPWAAGVMGCLFMKGLEKSVSYSVAHPTWQRTRPMDDEDTHIGWVFCTPGDAPLTSSSGTGSFECDDANVPDPVFGARTLREVYEATGGGATKFTTPILFDKETRTVVNNESEQILRMLNNCFNDVAEHPEMDIFPEAYTAELDSWNALVYPDINDGVYKCGFAQTQRAYDNAARALFAALDRVEAHLATSRYLTGAPFGLTWVDLRLFHTLVRFDPVYHTYFKANHHSIEYDYPNLLGFMRDVWQSFDFVRKTTNIRHIKLHYFTSHPQLNKYAIVPVSDGPDLQVPHGREHVQRQQRPAQSLSPPWNLKGNNGAGAGGRRLSSRL